MGDTLPLSLSAMFLITFPPQFLTTQISLELYDFRGLAEEELLSRTRNLVDLAWGARTYPIKEIGERFQREGYM